MAKRRKSTKERYLLWLLVAHAAPQDPKKTKQIILDKNPITLNNTYCLISMLTYAWSCRAWSSCFTLLTFSPMLPWVTCLSLVLERVSQ